MERFVAPLCNMEIRMIQIEFESISDFSMRKTQP